MLFECDVKYFEVKFDFFDFIFELKCNGFHKLSTKVNHK